MECGASGETSVWAQSRGKRAQTDASKGARQRCALSRIPEVAGSNRVGSFASPACVEDGDEGCPSQSSGPSEEREEPMSESPTDRDMLQQVLWRLGRIEKRLGIPEWRIGDSNPPPRSGPQGPIEPAVPPGRSKPRP